jgi:predicted ATPase
MQTALTHEFELEPLAPIPIKGMPEPLPIFRLVGKRTRAVRLTEPIYALPMVGRAAELALIGEKLDLALAGHGQVVGVSAEAGMGKSRLVAEVIRLARRKGLRGFGGACQSYGTNTPYLVWGPICRALFELDPDWPARKQIRMLESAIVDMAPERRDTQPLLGPLLGLPLAENDITAKLEPQFRNSALEALLTDCLQAAARDAAADGSGLLFVLEDLHWIDALSHDLLERNARAISELPVLIVLAYRPPELLRVQAPRVEALPHFSRVVLGPLTDAEAEQAIRAKLAQLLPERKGAPTPALIARITKRAQGNPFYVEELLNYLRDRGIDPQDVAAMEALDLPASLHTLILSRIDQLSERERAAIKVASVIGRLFRFAHLHGAYPVLGDAALLRADLDALARLELTPLDTPEPELTYLFKHIVTQEVAYESLTAQARASLHEQLAAYLEQVAGADTERFVDLLAYHYERSDNLAKKRAYLRRAGEAAAGRFANDAAVDYLTRALALAPTDDLIERYDLLSEREKIYDLQGARDAQARDLAALEDLAELLNDNLRRAVVAVRRSHHTYFTNDYARAITAATQAVALAEAANERAIAAEAYWRWSWALIVQGDLVEAHSKAVSALDLARGVDDPLSAANALTALGDIAKWRQEYASARDYYEQSLQMVRRVGDRRSEGWALGELANVVRLQQNYASALDYYEQCLTLYRTIGDRWGENWILGNLGRLALDQGDSIRAYVYLEQSQRISRSTNDLLSQAHLIGDFGWAMQSMGDYSAARTYHEQSLAIVQAANNHYGASFSYNNLGTVARNQGNLSDARSWYTRALDSAHTANRQQEGVARWGLGNVALDSGELDSAEAMYRAAVTIFEAGGHEARIMEAVAGLAAVALARNDSVQAKAHVGTTLDYLAHSSLNIDNAEEPFRVELICYQVLHALGDPRAPVILESAYQRLQERAAKIPDVRLRRSFLENVPHHRAIVAAWTQEMGA